MKKLLEVKSIVTLALTISFCFLSIKGSINADQFLTVFTVVISFFFGTRYQKSIEEGKND
jgi:hypothetical protein